MTTAAPRTALLLATLLLAACSPPTGTTLPGVGYVGVGNLPLDVLAYTAADAVTGNTTYRVSLKWSTVLGTKNYEIWRKFGDAPFAVLSTTDKDTYVDTSLTAKQSATYKIRAVDGSAKEIKITEEKGTTVLAQEVGKPAGQAPADNATLGSTDVPTLGWGPVPNASLYHVKVLKVADGSIAFSAITKDPSIKFGDASPLSFSAFQDLLPTGNPQGLAKGTVYRWTVQALRTDGGQDPAKIKAIDGNISAPTNFTLGG